MNDMKQRIVDALRYALEESEGIAAWTNWDDDDLPTIAEAVIDYLGLRQTTASGEMDSMGFIHTFPPSGNVHRYVSYVTKWMLADG